MNTAEVRTDAAEIALVPLEDVDKMLQRAASCAANEALAVHLPTRYKFRLRDIRTRRTGPEGDPAAGRPLTAECKFDVAECWMAYFPGCFAQTWGYRRALMGEMQDQPLFILSRDNYPSLEYAEEIPTRSTVRRLEYADEQRNAGAARRIYRPMMSAVDTLRFMASDFARRGAPKTACEAPVAEAASPRGACLPAETLAAAAPPAEALPAAAPPAEALPAAAPGPSQCARLAACENERRRLADLGARVAALGARGPGSPTHANKRRRLLRHETEFALRQTLVDAYLSLLQQLCAQGAQGAQCSYRNGV